MAQNDELLTHMMSGRSISPLEALAHYGVFRLAARIHDLKDMGVDVQKITRVNIKGKQYAEYFINPDDC